MSTDKPDGMIRVVSERMGAGDYTSVIGVAVTPDGAERIIHKHMEEDGGRARTREWYIVEEFELTY